MMPALPETPLTLPVDSTPVAEAVEMYARAELPPVPLYGLTADGHCACPSGRECPRRTAGKHPVGNAWQKRATLDIDEVRDRFRDHRGNVGIYLGLTGLVLLDADGQLGLDTAAAWSLPQTLTAMSGSGVGAHFIYRFAPNQSAAAVTDRSKFAPGLDVKARGQFVAAPSRHASGGVYRWTIVMPPAVLPDWLFDKLRRPDMSPPEPPSGTIETTSHLERRASAYMSKVDPAISGSGGHAQAFAAARILVGFVRKGLPQSFAHALLREYSARCEPPWSERELVHKWKQAEHATTIPRLEDRPRLHAISGGRSRPAPATPVDGRDDGDDQGPTDDGDPPAPPSPPGGGREPDWRQELLWTSSKSGADKLVSHSENVVRILQLSPDWRDRIKLDDFRSRVLVAGAPWDDYQKPTHEVGYWTDEDATRLCNWMRRSFHRYQFCPTVNDCERAVAVVAHNHAFNPVRDYLHGLTWDGTPRLSTWLTTYLGAESGEYARLIGTWWLISAVARVMVPGEKVDSVPILEGPQGIRKSSALKVLAGAEWFNDTPIDIGSKDAYSAIQGCWFVELAELESLVRSTPTKSKAFFSSSKDRFRRAYARHERDELRQCIFVGTVNLKEYLNDPTGARRFWPIKCTKIDLEAIARDRDQLWAEAMSEYQQGRTWYPETAADHALLAGPQEDRTVVDAWEPKLANWLDKNGIDETTTGDVLRDGLNLEPKDWTHSAQTRVGHIITARLRWQKRRVRRGQNLLWVYERPKSEAGT